MPVADGTDVRKRVAKNALIRLLSGSDLSRHDLFENGLEGGKRTPKSWQLSTLNRLIQKGAVDRIDDGKLVHSKYRVKSRSLVEKMIDDDSALVGLIGVMHRLNDLGSIASFDAVVPEEEEQYIETTTEAAASAPDISAVTLKLVAKEIDNVLFIRDLMMKVGTKVDALVASVDKLNARVEELEKLWK